MIDGVTTDTSLIAKSGAHVLDSIAKIASIVDSPISAEVAATNYDQMMQEAAVLAEIAPNVCIKLPLTLDGLRACRELSGTGAEDERDALLLG